MFLWVCLGGNRLDPFDGGDGDLRRRRLDEAGLLSDLWQ